MTKDGEKLRVLLSVRGPAPTTNPYIVQLGEAVAPDVDVRYFTWPRGLFGRYDVLHVHWPEIMIRRVGRGARTAARLRFALLLARTAATHVAIVRTVHNVRSHEQGDRVEQALLRWCDRLTSLWICLNAETVPPGPGRRVVIPHGHYRDWFASRPTRPVRPGLVMTFGLIRPYKGVDGLIAAFEGMASPHVGLRVVGRPSSDALRHLVTNACRTDSRIDAVLDYVDDATLAGEITQAQLVVLPYPDLHNSGALLLALSLGRPVLVPRNATTDALAAEVGEEWIRRYDGPISTAALTEAVAATTTTPADAPRLEARDWSPVGERHVSAYRAATARAATSTPGSGALP